MSHEKALLQRIQKRDMGALGELYDTYASRVYAHVVMLLGETTAAQEVTQDTFLKVWQHPEQYHYDTGHFVGWLLTVAHRTAVDRIRHDRRHTRALLASVDASTFPEIPDTAQADANSWREWMTLMDNLPAEQRDVIVLAYYHGLSQSEISAHLHLPLGTVKTRVRLGMEKLRNLLQD